MLVGLALTLSIPTVLADTIQVSSAPWVVVKPLSTIGLISHYSALYGVSSSTVYKVLECESKLSASAVGDHGTSFGIAQIHLPAHPEISKIEALDPYFSIEWTARQMSTGHGNMWSCFRNMGL